MKKLLAIILAICTCLSLCVMLASCGAEDNPYQAYAKKNGHKSTVTIDVKEGISADSDLATDYYSLYGKFDLGTDRNYNIEVTEIKRAKDEGEAKHNQTRIYFNIYYNTREEKLIVTLRNYTYNMNSETGMNKWNDGYSYTSFDGTSYTTEFTLDINKYFENGELKAEDALEPMTLDESRLSDSTNYIRDNSDWDWKAIAIEDILDAVNKTLSEVDKIIAE